MAEPLRVGILNDMAVGPSGDNETERLIRLPVDDLVASGRLDREVEFVHAWGLGLPEGTAAAVEHAFADLVAQDVLLIVGPAIGDNALIATPLADRHRVPTINWAGTERGRSEYMFHLQVGSHEDESLVLARHLASIGAERISVVFDRSPIGRRYADFFRSEAEALGLRVAASVAVAPLDNDTGPETAEALAAQPDAMVYLGLGISVAAVARTARESGWTGPAMMNTAGMRGYAPAFGQAIDGWLYIDMHSDTNTTLAALRDRLQLDVSSGPFPAVRYDLGRLVGEGLARAPERTRDGVREGLEQIKWLPAAQGHQGTLLGFGNYDRGALHGRYLVLRRWLDGQSIEV